MNKLAFFLNFLADPRIATFAATPQIVVRKVCGRINFRRDLVVVEYGPGDGAYTRTLLKKMTQGSKLIAIETNNKFNQQLCALRDDRLVLENDDARNVLQILEKNGVEKANYVISGIPFSLMNQRTKQEIIHDTREALEPGGKFIVYQFSRCLMKYLEHYFGPVVVKLEIGLPYYFVMEARK
jgi:phospholipid N-methyltransferase